MSASDLISTTVNSLTISEPKDTSLSICFTQKSGDRYESKALVTIRPDGSIEYGEGYTPDAAAKALWDAVGLERKCRAA